MAEVRPLRGILYNTKTVAAADAVAPPYDLITPQMREALYDKSPYNVVRIDYGKEKHGDSNSDNKYTRARSYLNDWLQKGILKRASKPAFYAYKMDYPLGGGRKSLSGFFGLLRLSEFGDCIYPHEATHSKPKTDRLMLMQATEANTSPIYVLYKSSRRKALSNALNAASSGRAHMKAKDQYGCVHSLHLIDGEEQASGIQRAMAGAKIFIADGHHRYETALEYSRRARAGNHSSDPIASDYVLAFFADIQDPSLTVLPTHRVVTVNADTLLQRLGCMFRIYELPPDADIMEGIHGLRHAFGLYAGGRRFVLKYRGASNIDLPPALKSLDVAILHKGVFGMLPDIGSWAYEMEAGKVMSMVDEGEYDAGFFLNPTPVRSVQAVALSGLRMPPKSTYFYPKVQTGFVINSIKTF